MGGGFGPEAVPGQDQSRPGQVREVALALVDVARLDVVPAGGLVERLVRGGFGGALRVLEAGAVGRTVDRERAVGGVHLVGQAGDRRGGGVPGGPPPPPPPAPPPPLRG